MRQSNSSLVRNDGTMIKGNSHSFTFWTMSYATNGKRKRKTVSSYQLFLSNKKVACLTKSIAHQTLQEMSKLKTVALCERWVVEHRNVECCSPLKNQEWKPQTIWAANSFWWAQVRHPLSNDTTMCGQVNPCEPMTFLKTHCI